MECYNKIKIVIKVVILKLQRGKRVEFVLKLCYVIYEWPLMSRILEVGQNTLVYYFFSAFIGITNVY